MSKRCQIVKKMSNVKESNTWTMEEIYKKIELTYVKHKCHILLLHHLCAPLLMGTGVMGHMGNEACPLLDGGNGEQG